MGFPEILEIKTRFHLKEILDKGLINLYQEIFGEPPEYQVWAETKITDFFIKYFSNGHLFIAVSTKLNPIGFCAIVPLTTSSIWQTEVRDGFSIHKLNQDFFSDKFGINAESGWYIADLGVAAQYRHLGLGTKLMQTAIAYRKPVLLRVSLVRERTIALYERLGFQHTNLFQKAYYQQQNNLVGTFEKTFMFLD